MSQDLERDAWHPLDDAGFAVIRSPASGSGRGDDQPDTVACAAGRRPYAIQFKASVQDATTLHAGGSKDDLFQLVRWCADAGAVPVVGVYWKKPGGHDPHESVWLYKHARRVRRSGHGENRRPRREDRSEWCTAEELYRGGIEPDHSAPPWAAEEPEVWLAGL